MTPKSIALITPNELDFHFRDTWLTDHHTCWFPAERFDEWFQNSTPDLVLIEGETEVVTWLEVVRTEHDLPVILISEAPQAELTAQFVRRITPTTETPDGTDAILQFGMHGVFYLQKPMRFQQFNQTLATGFAVTDYGETRHQLQLHRSIRRLHQFDHNVSKRLDRVRLRLSSLCQAFTSEKWEKTIASLEALHRELHQLMAPLMRIGFDVERAFPSLVSFERKSGALLEKWHRLDNFESVDFRSYLNALSAMAKLLDHYCGGPDET